VQTFIIRRLLIGIVVLFILSVTVFYLLRVVPGNPAIQKCGLACSAEQIEAIEEELGLNDPLYVQYWSWMKGVLTGDLGTSNVDFQPVSASIKNRMPVTLELMILTFIFTVIIGIPFGVMSAVFRNSATDYTVRIIAIFGLAVPVFWVATLVLVIPVTLWGYAPPIGEKVGLLEDPWGNFKQFGPPAMVLAIASAAGIMRLTRSTLLEVMRADYMRTARAKGLRERAVIMRHGLKNSMIPVITVLGLQITGLLGGAIIIEQIFALPGLGQYTFEALFQKDFEVVQTMTLYAGVVVIMINLLIDISYAWLDPRIRYS
jgi:peptide/nickel transport system permease protein